MPGRFRFTDAAVSASVSRNRSPSRQPPRAVGLVSTTTRCEIEVPGAKHSRKSGRPSGLPWTFMSIFWQISRSLVLSAGESVTLIA
ncbi:Uncharacterised protein [Mycobacterium tuberculosis]|nr:Uncharacterised protein [Mycobacterium tuberculosis]